jgi:glucose-1-phosphate cytidylyltransferase
MGIWQPSDITAVILAGGKGTRLAEESMNKPKPLVNIGAMPILWHIMKTYSAHGVRNFVICLGYKGYMIKEYFANYYLHACDVTFEFGKTPKYHNSQAEPWKVTLVDTGDDTMTGGRIKRVQSYLPTDRPFFMTYGDGVGAIPITDLLAFHQAHGKAATVTAVRPGARFGALDLKGDTVRRFVEKPSEEGGLINGGYFVLDPTCLDRIAGDTTLWEQEPLEGLAKAGELKAFQHTGFWQPMDTLRDKIHLNDLWASGQAPWKVW